MPEQSHRFLAHGDESTNHGRKGLDDAATQRPASHGAIARGWFNRALTSKETSTFSFQKTSTKKLLKQVVKESCRN